jgi:hypothetical protein
VPIGAPNEISECRRFFLEPRSAKQRQYEAFRAFFVEGRKSAEVARAFGYTPGSFQVMCHGFRRELHPDFFVEPRPGPRAQPKKSAARTAIIDFDMALLVIASGLYRLLARKMRGYGDAHADRIFRDLVDMPATVTVGPDEVTVRFHRRAHLPIVIDSGMLDQPVRVPWWNGASLRLTT